MTEEKTGPQINARIEPWSRILAIGLALLLAPAAEAAQPGETAVTVEPSSASADAPWVVYQGAEGPGRGKHIVLVSGDEEYRSEEVLPQLGRILALRYGFRCTVLFPIDPSDGTINTTVLDNIPGLEHLADADLMVLFTRFRDLPDEQMKHLVDYIESGRPILGIRTATHAFAIKSSKTYARYDWQHAGSDYRQGFGRQVLGETWINHHGHHGHESTRGIVAPGQENHPILRGIANGDIWGPTDVYAVRLPLPEGCTPLVLGQVVAGMKPTDPPVEGAKNAPMMPIAWTGTYRSASGHAARVFTTTMGAAQDFSSEGLRRLLVGACHWCVGLEGSIAEKSNVELVGTYEPTPFGYGKHKAGVRPVDLVYP
jgi:type 1 glutamine amidotransferase